jgi:CheY-like chemotaxis protein
MEQETKLSSSVHTGASSKSATLWPLLILLACETALGQQMAVTTNAAPESVSTESPPAEAPPVETTSTNSASEEGAPEQTKAPKAKSAKTKASPTNDSAPRVLSPGPENALTNRVYAAPCAPEPNPYADRDTWFLACAGFLAVALGVRKVLLKLSRHDPWNPRPDKFRAMLQRHCPTFYEFFNVLGAEPDQADVEPELPGESGRAPVVDADLLASTLAVITGLRARLAETSDEPTVASRLELLSEIRTELAAINPGRQSKGLRPIWQLISLLDGLLGEVSQNAAHLTPSVLRTIAGGLDILEALSVVALDTRLDSGPPVRLLAVDDDPISQHAVAFALKKVFPAPDIVGNGAAALMLAGKHTYDLIFLDIDLPGMDGFEVCARIHELPTNRETPVVFVTGYGDFDSRAQSTLSGAEDLIGKPYLTFEVALKALTLVLRTRLQPVRTA